MRHFMIGILAAVLCLAMTAACAEGMDFSGYSYEELLAMRDAINARLEEIEWAEALANADRRITFENTETTIYLRGQTSQRPAVERLTEEAPWRTEFEWSSSNPEVAAVDWAGTVTAVSAGDAEITAAAMDNRYIIGKYTVHVAVPVESIAIWGAEEPMALYNPEAAPKQTLGVNIEPEDATFQGVAWSSSDETIVTIDENGEMTGLQPGKAVITATSLEDPPANRAPKTATCTVTVIQMVTDIIPEKNEIHLFIGGTDRITATTAPENAANPGIVFASGDPEICTVDEAGTLTAAAQGECTVYLTAADEGGAAATVHVTVSRQVTGIEAPQEEIRLPIGKTRTIDVTVTPEDATNPELGWTSSNVFVARAANGVIEAVGQGECEVSCHTTDGSDLTLTFPVRVPSFSVEEDTYTVTEKSGLTIPVQKGSGNTRIDISSESSCFDAFYNESDSTMTIVPYRAGEGTVILNNPEEEKDRTEILITIADSAVFNEVSYPRISYDALVQQPETYEGTQISLYGLVLQKQYNEDGSILLMVGTGGAGFTDQVFQVRLKGERPSGYPEEGETATFYGLFRNEKIFSEALGSEITVPGLETERIVKDQVQEN